MEETREEEDGDRDSLTLSGTSLWPLIPPTPVAVAAAVVAIGAVAAVTVFTVAVVVAETAVTAAVAVAVAVAVVVAVAVTAISVVVAATAELVPEERAWKARRAGYFDDRRTRHYSTDKKKKNESLVSTQPAGHQNLRHPTTATANFSRFYQ